MGPHESSDTESKGFIPRALEDILDKSVSAKCICFQLYQEKAYDLLNHDGAMLEVRGTPETGFYVQGITEHQILDLEDALGALRRGFGNRKGICLVNSSLYF